MYLQLMHVLIECDCSTLYVKLSQDLYFVKVTFQAFYVLCAQTPSSGQYHSGVSSGGKKRSKHAEPPPPSPRGRRDPGRSHPAPLSGGGGGGKQLPNGRLPPTY